MGFVMVGVRPTATVAFLATTLSAVGCGSQASADAGALSSSGSGASSSSGTASSSSGGSSDAGNGVGGSIDSGSESGGADATDSGLDSAPPGENGWGTPVDGGVPFSGSTVMGTATVTRGSSAGQIGPGFAGFSFEKTHMTNGSFTGQNSAMIALFKLVGPTVLRIGADDVDVCEWDPTALPGGGGPPYSHSIGTADVDDLGAMLTAAGARVIYGVNFHTATPASSAAEAAYVTTHLGANVYGFEIGNEINRYGSWTTLRPTWESFATAILAAAPGAHLIGPAAGGGDALSLTTPFAEEEAKKNLILLTQHYYAGTANQDTVAYYVNRLLTVDPDPPTSQDGLIGTLTTTNAAAVANAIPDGFRLGECNTFADHGQDGVSNALISALWSLDFMFTSAQYGASGVNFHGGETGMDGNTPFYYSPITETDGVVTGVAPLFYGMLLFNLAGPGQALATTAAAGNVDFTAYALERTDGATSVVLNNKDTTSGVQATVDVGTAVASASAIYLQGPTPASLTATSGMTLAGAGITPGGAWNRNPPYALSTSGSTVSVLVPPASAALVRVQ
jgi:hypothetical protein